MDDLDKLIAKLDEGRDREAVELVWPVFGDRTPTGLVLAAIAKPSSVDMALRLKDAVALEWEADNVFEQQSLGRWTVYLGYQDKRVKGVGPTLARALLLAILRAVKAQQSPGGGA